MKGENIYAIVLLILSCGLLTSCFERATYILPDHYEGKVEIIYNDSSTDARPLTYKNGKRVFKIPPSGVLKTNAGYVNISKDASKFYYIKANGSFQLLEVSGKIMKCRLCIPTKDSGTISIGNNEHFTTKGEDKHKAESFVITFNHETIN